MTSPHVPENTSLNSSEGIGMSNSTEMVERVARALNPAIFAREGGHGEGECPYCDDERKEARRLARAAVEAMREPTQAMEFDGGIKAENMLFGGDPDYTGVIFTDMGFVYRAMIDQALSPDPALSPEDEGRERK